MTVDRLRQIVRLRLRSLFSGTSVDRELDEELRYHVEQQIQSNLERGMTPIEARRAALVAMGGVRQTAEQCRDQRGFRGVDAAVADSRYAFRVLKRSPVFGIVAIASLALGIGAFLTMFQLVDAIRLRPLPVDDAHELVEIRIQGGRGGWGISNTAAEITLPLWEQIRTHQTVLADVFAWGREGLLMGTGAEAVPVRGLYFSGGVFPALRTTPAHGRLLSPADDEPGCEGAVVLSHAFWRSRLGGDPAVIGASITLLQQRFPVIGVAPPEFTGLEVGRAFDVALPICAASRFGPSYVRRDFWWLNVMGRLPAAISLAQAGEHLRALSPGLIEATLPPGHSPESLARYRGFGFTAVDGSRGVSRLRAAYESPLWVLLGTTGLILLLTLSNLATLMLARAHARRRELAMLVALGASRGRLISQIVLEAVFLSAAGVALALPLAIAAGRLLVAMLSTEFDPLHVALGIDWRAAGVAAAVVAITALAFGVLPALHSSRFDPLPVLRSGGRSHTVDRRRAALQRLLVAGQMAMCFVLVVSALLFARSLYNITATDVGFNPNGLQVVGFGDPNVTRLSLAERHVFQQALIDTIGSIPGVQSAGAVSQVPLSGASWNQAFHLRGNAERLSAKFTYVSPGYFQTLQVPVHWGRAFDAADRAQSRPVAIVNDAFVHRFLGGTADAAVVKTFTEPGYPPTAYEVVGRVGNTKYGDVREDDLPIVYVPLAQAPTMTTWKSVIVRTSLTPGALGESVRRRVKALNPDIWVRMTDLPAQLDQRVVRERMMAWLAGAFGVLAVSLAAVGLYGLMAYLSVGRRAEIGVRLALGATRAGVVLMMVRESAGLVAAGLGAGLVLSFLLARGASSLLFQLAPTDALTWAGAGIALAIVAGIAAVVPAWRTAGLDPVTTLRAEES
jgi:putative ABC transport system permease protein